MSAGSERNNANRLLALQLLGDEGYSKHAEALIAEHTQAAVDAENGRLKADALKLELALRNIYESIRGSLRAGRAVELPVRFLEDASKILKTLDP